MGSGPLTRLFPSEDTVIATNALATPRGLRSPGLVCLSFPSVHWERWMRKGHGL